MKLSQANAWTEQHPWLSVAIATGVVLCFVSVGAAVGYLRGSFLFATSLLVAVRVAIVMADPSDRQSRRLQTPSGDT